MSLKDFIGAIIMNTTLISDETVNEPEFTPGARLRNAREANGYGIDYVAGKLHLRLQVVELLEADDYDNMPEPVFIKGYLRAYANLVGEDAHELLRIFNQMYQPKSPPAERTLWQSKREVNPAERAVKWFTIIFSLIVISAVAVWWYNSTEHSFKKNNLSDATMSKKVESEIRLTDLSKMRSLLSQNPQYSSLESLSE